MSSDHDREREEANHEAHEDLEGHEEKLGTDDVMEEGEVKQEKYCMRLPSPVGSDVERLVTRTIGAALVVHRTLGPGFLESIYRRAMCLELAARGIAFEVERSIHVQYRGVNLPGQRIDLIVESAIVVELKSVMKLDEIHRAQLISYLKTTGLRVGLLINFRVPALRMGLKRVVV